MTAIMLIGMMVLDKDTVLECNLYARQSALQTDIITGGTYSLDYLYVRFRKLNLSNE